MNKGNPTSEEKEDTSINEELLILQNNGVYRREMLLQLTEINKSLAILTSLISKFTGE
jgi:hypothetical protein